MVKPDGILYTTHQFEENKTLLNTIADLAKLFSATLHVAVFNYNLTADATDYLDHTRHLTQYIDFLNKAYPEITCKDELLVGNDFEETIEKYDSKNEVDIIAMITYPKSFWERFIKKSMTKKMAFHTKIPLLAIQAK